MNTELPVDKFFEEKLAFLSTTQNEKYSKLGLRFNPFPKSGTTNINSSDLYTEHLRPFNHNIESKIFNYILNCFSINENDPSDKLNTAVITGDYGLGKTQLLMYVKYLLGKISQDARINRKPFVVYIDNPGVKLSEFIGSIIEKIGEENFKKFLWNKIIKQILADSSYKNKLQKFHSNSMALWGDNTNPYDAQYTISHKTFLDALYASTINLKARKELDAEFKKIKIEILENIYSSPALAQYFYDIVSNDTGVNKSWEAISSGNIKLLEKKEYLILKSIVDLTKEQGFTDFFILVDEFEDITKGRLNKSQVDNYLYNLRLLLDEHREWCLLFAMTGDALVATKKASPPLADRIGMTTISLTKLNPDQINQLTLNYLNLSRENISEDLKPFTVAALKLLNDNVEGSTRRYLKGCYNLIEKAAELFIEDNTLIDDNFVSKYLNIDFE